MKSYSLLFALTITIGFTHTAKGQIISTFAGSKVAGYAGDGGPASSAQLNRAVSLAADGEGNIYLADYYNHVVRKINKDGIITTVAGNHTMGYSGDGGPATAAKLHGPWGIAIDADGNIFIADKYNHAVRRVSTAGTITTVAGNGTPGYSGDGAAATAARLYRPLGLCLDNKGNLYVADNSNTVVRKITPDGIISTFAGNNKAGSGGDGGPATAASLRNVRAVAADATGNIYISDTWNSIIRKVDAKGIISTFAGYRVPGSRGDGGPATLACLHYPVGITTDADGSLYIADNFNHSIRKVAPDGKITTIAGNGTKGFSGDGGPATAAKAAHPTSLAICNGNLYFTEFTNNIIRTVSLGAPKQETIATSGITVYPNPASDIVTIDLPARHSTGNLQITDLLGHVVEKRAIESAASRYTCNLDRCSPGTYLLHIIAGTINYTTKITVTR